ncbi:hypothetical protein ACEWY4_001276 [Coilia grayii]|uniref:Uncharacterized protein n=1 Tax=Coilia grayii TaxID=363190 RepID=A0ABD1KTK8_9TELE
MLDELVTKDPTGWESLFDRATQRAKQSRGKRLKESTLLQVKELVSLYFTVHSDYPCTQTEEPNHNHTDTRATETPLSHEDDPMLTDTNTNTPETPMDIPRNLKPIQIGTPQLKENQPTLNETTEEDLPSTGAHETTTFRPRILQQTPKTQKTKTKTSGINKKPDSTPQLKQTRSTQHIKPTQSIPQTPRETPMQTAPIPGTMSDLQTTNLTPIKVTKHSHVQQKARSWTLSIEKPILIIGDENLERIEQHYIKDMQIDSYPGAQFLHAEALIGKAKINCQVQNVILSFGINHRHFKFEETTTKQILNATKKAKDTFPGANIYIPMLNFANTLPSTEISNLQRINGHIQHNHQHILPLPDDLFHTEQDHVHWTSLTANQMLNHRLSSLN